jgi:hypothetical protein
LLARITPGETFRVLNSKGEWFDGAGLCERYFFDGEPGAESIDEDAATKLAETFGNTLSNPQELERTFGAEITFAS